MHHLGGGVTSDSPASAAAFASVSRTDWFAATPPATTTQLSVLISPADSSASFAHPIARLVRSSRCFTAAA